MIIFVFLKDVIQHPNYAEGQISQEVVRHQMYGLDDKQYYFTLIDALHQVVRAAQSRCWNDITESSWQDIAYLFKGQITSSINNYL